MTHPAVKEALKAKEQRVSLRGSSTFHYPRGVCIIPYRAGRLAVSQRTENVKMYKKWWQFPGGGVNEGETARDAAIREFKEETGILLSSNRLHLLARRVNQDQNGNLYVAYRFGVELLPDEELQNTEPEKNLPWEWRTFGEIEFLQMIEDSKADAWGFWMSFQS